MVKTYFSLFLGKGILEGKRAVNAGDLTIILTQLFRHEATGIFPDDSGPTLPILEAATLISPTKEGK